MSCSRGCQNVWHYRWHSLGRVSWHVLDSITLCPIAFLSKNVFSTEWWYSSMQQEALCILHGLEKFHCYWFAKEVNIITDHKPLLAVVSKDITTLSQLLQCIMLNIQQYNICILYKPGPGLCIGEWLSDHKHTKIKRNLQQHKHTQCGNRCSSLLIKRRHQNCNEHRCRTTDATDAQNKKMAEEQRWLKT